MRVLKYLQTKLVLLAFIVFIPMCALLTNQSVGAVGYATNINMYDLNSLANQQRASAGLAPLNINYQLTSAANSKAYHMFANNYWAHIAPDGTSPWNFILGSGYDYTSAGENLAKDFSTSAGVINGWMNSAGHRANVLGSSYQDVGYAIINGTLLGSETTLVVAMYGASVAVTATPVVTPPTPTPTPNIVEQPSAPAPVVAAPSSAPTQTTTSTPTATLVTNTPITTADASQPTPSASSPVKVIAKNAKNPTSKVTGATNNSKKTTLNVLGSFSDETLSFWYAIKSSNNSDYTPSMEIMNLIGSSIAVTTIAVVLSRRII